MTNTNYDFMGFMNYQGGATTTKETKVRPATAGQIKYYNDLCTQRNIQPQPASSFSFDTMSEEIKRLMSFYPASPAQVKIIVDKVNNIKSIVSTMSFTEEQVTQFENDKENKISFIIYCAIKDNLKPLNELVKELTGGREGTASKLIESLIGVEKQFSDMQGITEPQLEILVNMFFCPDIPFENFDILRKIDLGEGLWRKPTPEEFANQIKVNLNKADASKFIDDYRGIFYDWKKTRIRPEQMRYIQELESRLGSQSPTTEINEAFTLFGDLVQVGKNKREYIKGEEYVPLTQEQLIQFTIEQASQFIDQLKSELNRKEGSSFLELELDYNELRTSHSEREAIEMEYKEFLDLMFRLEAVAGYADEDLHDSARILLIEDDNPNANQENRKKIRGFMKELLATGAITFNGLMELARDCPTALRILVDM